MKKKKIELLNDDYKLIADLVAIYCKIFQIERILLMTTTRRQIGYITYKHFFWYILRSEYGIRTTSIASFFDLRSHATIVYASSRIKDLIDIKDKEVMSLVEKWNELKPKENV